MRGIDLAKTCSSDCYGINSKSEIDVLRYRCLVAFKIKRLVFLGSVRSGSSSLNLELEPELEPAHLAVFRTRTEPEPMILELEPNPNL